jgi:hypothetical protein
VNIANVQTPPGRPPKLAAVREFKNDYFVNLLVMGSKWKAVPGFDGVFEGRGIRLRHDMKTARQRTRIRPCPAPAKPPLDHRFHETCSIVTIHRAREVALADGTCRACRAGADTAGLPENPFFLCGGQALGLHAQTVQRCIERAKAEGALAALDERPPDLARSRRSPWRPRRVVALACRNEGAGLSA